MDSIFQFDEDYDKSTSSFVFTLSSGAISWKSVKRFCIVESTMKVEYVVASEVSKEVVWLHKFLMGLGVVPLVLSPQYYFVTIMG